MADQHDFQALDWVTGEIEETLKQAQQSLEAFVENPEDTTRMRFCLTHLHQVAGTLQMVEFFGAALLAEEMENLAIALINQKVQRVEDAQEVLMKSILQLPVYLDRVKEGQSDRPVIVLPLLNDLRAARGENLLSDTALFKPDLNAGSEAAPQEAVPQEALDQLPQLLKKIRQLYQFALVGVIRNQDMPTNLGYMAKALVKLEQLYSKTPMGQMWWVAAAMLEAVTRSYLELGTSVKMLMGQLDRQLKNSIDSGASRDEAMPTELLKNLLYYVARADGETKRIQQVRAAFKLDQALPADKLDDKNRGLSGPDREAINSVVSALLEELGGIKETLDLFMRGQAQDSKELRSIIPALKQVADTLAVLGTGNPRRVVMEQIDIIGGMVDKGQLPSDNQLMDVAGALLYVEATLQGMSSDASMVADNDTGNRGQFVSPEQISKARAAVIDESRAGLETAKEAISEYIASNFDAINLQSVPDTLRSVRGGLMMVPLAHPAALLQSCIGYISEQLIDAGIKPDWKQLDTLADAITSVEYYLERLGDRFPGDEDILAIAEDAVADLGYPAVALEAEAVAAAPVAEIAEPDLAQAEPLEAASLEVQVVAPEVEATLQDETEFASEEIEATEIQATAVEAIEVEAIEVEEQKYAATEYEEPEFVEAELSEPQETTETYEFVEMEVDAEPEVYELPAEPELEVAAVEVVAAPVPTPAPVAVVEEEDDLIDEEVIEIFIEEAGEVLETINEFLPQWKANYEDEAALKEVRRAYHTLKGSGRMVGASILGELAWSVENMLNRVLDNSIATTPAVTGIVETVTGVVPVLVTAFEQRVKPDLNVDALAAVADALSKGEQPPALPADLSLAAVAEAPAPVAEEAPAALVEVAETDVAETDEAEIPDYMAAEYAAEAEPEIEEELTLTEVALEEPVADEPVAEELPEVEAIAMEAVAEPWQMEAEVEQQDTAEDYYAVETAEAEATEVNVTEFEVTEVEATELETADAESIDVLGFDAESADAESGAVEEHVELLAAADSEAMAEPQVEFVAEAVEAPAEEQVANEEILLEGSSQEAEIDPMLVDIFSQEANSHLDTLKDYLLQKHYSVLSDDMLRALHTLKGSAHMAGITPIAELASPVERFFKECHLQGVSATDDIRELLADFVSLVEQGLDDLMAHPSAPIVNSEALLQRVERMREEKLKHSEDEANQQGRPDPQVISMFVAEGADLIMDAGEDLKQWEHNPVPGEQLEKLRQAMRIVARSASAAQLNEMVELSMTLEELYEAAANGMITPHPLYFRTAHRGHESLVNMMDMIAAGQPIIVDESLIPDLQALMDESPQVNEQLENAGWNQELSAAESEPAFASAIESAEHGFELEEATAEEAFGFEFEPSEPEDNATPQEEPVVEESVVEEIGFTLQEPEELIVESTDAVEAYSEDEFEELVEEPVAEPVAAAVFDADNLPADYDPELVEIFLEEAADILDTTAEQLQSWINAPQDLEVVAGLQRSLHTLKGGARMSDMREMGDLSHHLENLYEGLCKRMFTATPVLFELLHQCHDRLAVMFEAIQAGQQAKPADDLIGRIDDFTHGRLDSGTAAASTPAPAAGAGDTAALTALGGAGEEVDTEILEIFLEEAEELAEGIDHTIAAWLDDRANREHLNEMKRLLHTLKGGARLAGLVNIGNLSHNFESFLIESEIDRVAMNDEFFHRVQAEHDSLIEQMTHLRKHGSELISAAGDEVAEEFEFSVGEALAPLPEMDEDTVQFARTEAGTSQPLGDNVIALDLAAGSESFVAPKPEAMLPASAFHAEDKRRASGESIKVAAELMENLVNLAGETSIFRGRIEQEITDFNKVIGEVGMTIDRARELLRRLDIETEAQIVYRYQQQQQTEGEAYEDFDPLEMDRYSTLNQLSRSLGETVSDLMDLRDSLTDRARDAETLLIQQSRVNSELQESLMRTRMVPFSRMVPRLRRIVRQIAAEVGKKAELEIVGAEGEMDRTVLERMVPPLEHMLRNAVDHGLETPQQRVAAGKPETGRITIHLSREGGEVVLRLTDDGKGINLEGVRNRAIERGLMKVDAPLTDKEIMQFIFKPGFSTAEKVTQISGRGVGMDVVHSEIKQLGGNVKLHSAPGAGSQFTIRLPFTVSVNRALMVRVGEDQYAIPLNHIEGIVRVSPYELEAYYQPDAPKFEYASQQYIMRYLGRYVHNNPIPNLVGHNKPIPVLLVRGGDHVVALQVDALLGSREVVVKSVGPQLAAVSGISGATIRGDGSVVIILDLNAVIRADQAQFSEEETLAPVQEQAAPEVNEMPLVMVVDDSVTVRKVTTRLLERNGYEVVTAKDGVDAITQLQDIKPDVMLLDIEMPRMDGFEVATLVRHDDRLQDTPIIMITSRTGEKHHDRAMSIGVNRYMGKPYQETVLLQTIEELIRQEA